MRSLVSYLLGQKLPLFSCPKDRVTLFYLNLKQDTRYQKDTKSILSYLILSYLLRKIGFTAMLIHIHFVEAEKFSRITQVPIAGTIDANTF